jgi:AcrR family transcriptional regulator
MAQRPLKSKKAVDRRQQLLEAAIEVFGERDYDDVSMDDVAERAGVSHGLVFQYFGTKRDLYVATVEPLIQEFRRRINPPEDLPPVERLRSALRSYADLIAEHPTGYRSLMTRGLGFKEVREGLDRARWRGVARMAKGMGLDPKRPEVRVGLRAWIGFMDTSMLAWLDVGGFDRDALVEMQIRTLGATAEAIATKKQQ